MSKIEAQIKLLQSKKAKISFLNTILASTKDYKNDDFIEIKEDVVKLLSDFINETIVRIEDDVEVKTQTNLTDDEINTLKTIVKKAKAKVTVPELTIKDVQVPYVAPKPVEVDNDSVSAKLDFALANQHFSGRRVSVDNNENLSIIGEVVGLDAPHILVKVENGPIIKVPPHKVKNT